MIGGRITPEEVLAVLRDVARGAAPFEWDDWGVDYVLTTSGWTIAIFNDFEQLDYVQWALAPDGRRAEFSDLYSDERGDPINMMDVEDLRALYERVGVDWGASGLAHTLKGRGE